MSHFLSCRAGFAIPSANFNASYLTSKLETRDDRLLLTVDFPFIRQFVQLIQLIPLTKLMGMPESSVVDMTFYYRDIKYFSISRGIFGVAEVRLHIENRSDIKNIDIVLSNKCLENLVRTLKERGVKQQ